MSNTPEDVRELLHYDPSTGILTWRPRGMHWFDSAHACNAWNAKFSGKPAGHKRRRSDGYISLQIRLLGRLHYAHRLAWAVMTGKQPPDEIDHIDGDAMNNAWVNLRDGGNSANRKNVPMYSSNTSGVCGVHWHKASGRWMARVNHSGRSHYLGLFDDMDEAHRIVREFRDRHGFTDRHGMPRRSTTGVNSYS